MVATDGNRDTAALQRVTRNGQRDTLREARSVEHEDSGEGALRVPTLRAPQPSKQRHSMAGWRTNTVRGTRHVATTATVATRSELSYKFSSRRKERPYVRKYGSLDERT